GGRALGDRYGRGHAEYGVVEPDRCAGGFDRQRDRWVDGFGRADDAHPLPSSRPSSARGDAHTAHRLATCGARLHRFVASSPWAVRSAASSSGIEVTGLATAVLSPIRCPGASAVRFRTIFPGLSSSSCWAEDVIFA